MTESRGRKKVLFLDRDRARDQRRKWNENVLKVEGLENGGCEEVGNGKEQLNDLYNPKWSSPSVQFGEF